MRRLWIALAAVLAACGGSVAGNADPAATPAPTPAPTVPGVGPLPVAAPATSAPETESLVVIARPLNSDGEVAELVGDQVTGNRLLIIGDSIFAGTESRYGGEMCAALEPLGWAVEVAAEAGRFVEFGVKVVRQLVPEPASEESDAVGSGGSTTTEALSADDDWDAAAVFLGSNYDGDQENYDANMREILDRLAPRPTLLYSVTEYRTNYVEVSEVIEGLVADYPNVTLIDWATAAKTPGVLRADGLHPNDEGEQVLVDLTAAALGDAPAGEADCIRSRFRDDSAINEGNGSPNTGGSSSGSTSGGSSTSGGGSSTSTGSSTSSGGGTTGATDGGTTDGGSTDGGSTDGGSTDGGSTDGGSTDGGSTDGGSTDGGSTDGGSTDGGSTDGGSTDGGSTDGGSTDGGSTDGGSTDGGSTDGGSTDGGSTDGGTPPPTAPPATAPPTAPPTDPPVTVSDVTD